VHRSNHVLRHRAGRGALRAHTYPCSTLILAPKRLRAHFKCWISRSDARRPLGTSSRQRKPWRDRSAPTRWPEHPARSRAILAHELDTALPKSDCAGTSLPTRTAGIGDVHVAPSTESEQHAGRGPVSMSRQARHVAVQGSLPSESSASRTKRMGCAGDSLAPADSNLRPASGREPRTCAGRPWVKVGGILSRISQSDPNTNTDFRPPPPLPPPRPLRPPARQGRPADDVIHREICRLMGSAQTAGQAASRPTKLRGAGSAALTRPEPTRAVTAAAERPFPARGPAQRERRPPRGWLAFAVQIGRERRACARRSAYSFAAAAPRAAHEHRMTSPAASGSKRYAVSRQTDRARLAASAQARARREPGAPRHRPRARRKSSGR
jgi:hypothetical protein